MTIFYLFFYSILLCTKKMFAKVLPFLTICNILNIHVNGLYVGDGFGKEGNEQPANDESESPALRRIDDKAIDYLRRLHFLGSKVSDFLLRDQGSICSTTIVNNGHVQGISIPNKTDVSASCSSENFDLKMKYAENAVQDLELRLRQLSSLTENINPCLDTVPRDCSEVQSNKSGVYLIRPIKSNKPFNVTCDMDIDGGGWTVFQNRYEGKEHFYRGWEEYKQGFGPIDGEHWLGLQKLHELTTSQIYELYVKLEDFDGVEKYARFSLFVIDGENTGYRLSVLGDYNGTAGDAMRYQVGQKFTTFDKKQDNNTINCAVLFTGAWWYNACHHSNLNGKYFKGEVTNDNHAKGMCWYTFRGHGYSLKSAKMMIRPRRSN